MAKTIASFLSNISTTSFEGKDIFVTGGNSGIGYATCSHLLKLGAKVHLCARNESRGMEAVNKLQASYPQSFVTLHLFDASSFESLDKFIQDILASKQNIDAFIHNAGVYHLPKKILDNGIEQTAFVNALAPLYIHDRLKGYLSGLGHPVSEVFTTSLSNWLGRFDPKDPFSNNTRSAFQRYANSKAAVFVVARELMIEKGNIDVLLTHPGSTYTPLINKAYPKWFAFIAKGFMKIVFHSPEKAALCNILSLANNDNSFYYRPRGLFSFSGFPKAAKYPPILKKKQKDVMKAYKENENFLLGKKSENK